MQGPLQRTDKQDARTHTAALLLLHCTATHARRLDFGEVAGLFRQLSPEQGERSACNAAVEALLLADRNADSALTRAEFETMLARQAVAVLPRLPLALLLQNACMHTGLTPRTTHLHQSSCVRRIADVSGMPLQAAAEQLLRITREQRAAGVPQTVSGAAPAAQQLQQVAAGEAPSQPLQQQQQHADKLLQLFKHWDKAGDGSICFEEICQGLAKFTHISGKQVHTPQRARNSSL